MAVLIGSVLAIAAPRPDAPPLVWFGGRYTRLDDPA